MTIDEDKWELHTYVDSPDDWVIRHLSKNCMACTPTYRHSKEVRRIYDRSSRYYHYYRTKLELKCTGCNVDLPKHLVIQRDLLNDN